MLPAGLRSNPTRPFYWVVYGCNEYFPIHASKLFLLASFEECATIAESVLCTKAASQTVHACIF